MAEIFNFMLCSSLGTSPKFCIEKKIKVTETENNSTKRNIFAAEFKKFESRIVTVERNVQFVDFVLTIL